jgi:hypothetical protein
MPGASIEMDLTTVSAMTDILEMDLPAQVKTAMVFWDGYSHTQADSGARQQFKLVISTNRVLQCSFPVSRSYNK